MNKKCIWNEEINKMFKYIVQKSSDQQQQFQPHGAQSSDATNFQETVARNLLQIAQYMQAHR